MSPFIRELDPSSESEIDLVASRMRQTLVEVVGTERGNSMYSSEWLRDRVLWHLDATKTTAKVFLSENHKSEITGQAIARIEHDADGSRYGYFSTIYVDALFRRQGIATQLLLKVENWFCSVRVPRIVYNTGVANTRTLDLFTKHGYVNTLNEGEMIQLTKSYQLID